MKSAFEQIIGGKRKRVVSADELPSPRQPRTTIESPTRSTLQSSTIETVPSGPIQSASESHRTPDPDPSAATTSQPSLRERLFPNGETYGLRVLHEPAEPLVDIIFVHGLTGDSYNTWLEAESGIYWPVHLLSKDVPEARIMTFGYDADVTKFLGPVSQNNLRDHASGLLGKLAAVRCKDESTNRKIIFIVHSLGGLITKKALCLSEQAIYPRLQQIHRCTIAVAFLGTPHRGSDLSPFATSVANILKAGGKRVNKEILQLLKRDSEVLADVEDSFAVWLRKYSQRFELTCFFEELELPAIGMVVTKESAKIVGYPQYSVHANHSSMAKFSSAKDPGYTQICDELKGWLTQLGTLPVMTITLTQDEQGCLRSLAFPEMKDRSNDIVPAADGTCTWLLKHPKYKNWISQHRGLLWIKGKPGAGKSTLLKYGLFTLPTMEPPLRKPLTISFFFHGRGAELQKTPLGLYRSLLYQLLERFPKALSHLVQTFKSNCAGKGDPGEFWNWHVQELRDFVESSLTKILEESAIRIFVDALDECGEEEARRLVRSFEHLYSKSYSAPYGLSICYSCRHWPVIAPDNCQEICAERENRKDVTTYIQEELQSVVLDPEERATLQDKIEARSECVFQWVVLVMPRIVGMCRDGKTLRQCLEVLKEIPQDLDALYETIIHSLKRRDQDQSMKLFQWICFAHRPLSIAELRCAMNVDGNPAYQSFQDCKKLPWYIETDMQMEKQLRSLSGGLAEWKIHEHGCVAQLVHQSVNDYLISKGFHRFEVSLDSVDKIVGASQSRLSRSCLVYFAMDEIKRRLRDFPSRPVGGWVKWVRRRIDSRSHLRAEYSFLEYTTKWWLDRASVAEYPFLEYTTEWWLNHAQVAEEHGMPQDGILQYLQRHSAGPKPYWVELCRLIGSNGCLDIDETILHAASSYNLISLVSAILNSCERYNVDINSNAGLGYQTPLSLAAKNGHEGVVKLLLAQPNVHVNSTDWEGQTPLSLAAENGREGVVKLLLAQPNVHVNSTDWEGQTPLSLAAENGREGVVKLLLAQPDVDVDFKDECCQTPLSWAATNGCEAVIKLLLAQPDVDINSVDGNDQTPLSHAAEEGQEGVTKLLLAHPDIDINTKDVDSNTPLTLATMLRHQGVIKLLQSKGALSR